MEPGYIFQRWNSVTAGTYVYKCRYHDGMPHNPSEFNARYIEITFLSDSDPDHFHNMRCFNFKKLKSFLFHDRKFGFEIAFEFEIRVHT